MEKNHYVYELNPSIITIIPQDITHIHNVNNIEQNPKTHFQT